MLPHVAAKYGVTGSAASRGTVISGKTIAETAGTAGTVATSNADKVAAATQQVTQTVQNTPQVSQNGKLYETAITLKDGRVVIVMAEVVVDGKNLLLNNIAMYSNAGDIPNQAGSTVIRELIRSTQNLAYQEGFGTLRLFGERAMHSTSANPGMVIDRLYDLLKIFGGK